MIETVTTYVSWSMTNWNSSLAVLLYWVPALFCAIFYFVRTVNDYQDDVISRDIARSKKAADPTCISWYTPNLTVGVIVGRALLSILPVANIFGAIFDLAPRVFGRFFKILGQVFNQPLVPK